MQDLKPLTQRPWLADKHAQACVMSDLCAGLNPPAQHVLDSWQSAEFWANKVLREHRTSAPAQVCFTAPDLSVKAAAHSHQSPGCASLMLAEHVAELELSQLKVVGSMPLTPSCPGPGGVGGCREGNAHGPARVREGAPPRRCAVEPTRRSVGPVSANSRCVRAALSNAVPESLTASIAC